MESESYKQFLAAEIVNEINRQRRLGRTTSKGEPISKASIARACDPPVSRTAVHLVIEGKTESRRIKQVIERELGRAYWIRKDAA